MSFISLKEVMAKDIVKRAKDLAWDTFSKEEQENFLESARENQDAYSAALAAKCLKEAEDAFNAPGFVSRADLEAYSDYRELEMTKQSVDALPESIRNVANVLPINESDEQVVDRLMARRTSMLGERPLRSCGSVSHRRRGKVRAKK